MQLRRRKPLDELEQTTTPGRSATEESTSSADRRNVVVSHGIHRGRFPVGSLSVAEARRMLAPLINVDPDAVAVINGSPVQEETIISEQVTMLSFVKPSSIRG